MALAISMTSVRPVRLCASVSRSLCDGLASLLTKRGVPRREVRDLFQGVVAGELIHPTENRLKLNRASDLILTRPLHSGPAIVEHPSAAGSSTLVVVCVLRNWTADVHLANCVFGFRRMARGLNISIGCGYTPVKLSTYPD